MSNAGNPYRELLGWPSERPPNYYELLGFPSLAEVSREAVAQAAERLKARILRQSPAPPAELQSRLLAEVELARKCLCDPQRKAQYDKALRRSGLLEDRPQSGTASGGSASSVSQGSRPAGPTEADLLPPGAVVASASNKTPQKNAATGRAPAGRPATLTSGGVRSGASPARAAAADVREALDGLSPAETVELPPGITAELPPDISAELPPGLPAAAPAAVAAAYLATDGAWPAAGVMPAPQGAVSAMPTAAASPIAVSTAPSAAVYAARRQRSMRRAVALLVLGSILVLAVLGGVVNWLIKHSPEGGSLALVPGGSSPATSLPSPAAGLGAGQAAPGETSSSGGAARGASGEVLDPDPGRSPGGARRVQRRPQRGEGADRVASSQTDPLPEGLPGESAKAASGAMAGGKLGPPTTPAGPDAPAGASMPAPAMTPGSSASGSVPGSAPTSAPAAQAGTTEARPMPMEPAAPPVTRAEVERLIRELESARMALAEHQFSVADQHLAQADRLAKTEEQKQAVARVRRLADLLAAFRQALLAQLQSMQGGETFKVGASTQVTLVEVNESRVVVRMAGMNRSYPLNEVPPGLALAIVDLRYRQGDPAGLQAKAAFLIAQKKPSDDTRQKARSLLEEAQTAGADVSDLLRLLEEHYTDWLKELPAKASP